MNPEHIRYLSKPPRNGFGEGVQQTPTESPWRSEFTQKQTYTQNKQRRRSTFSGVFFY